MDFKFKDKYNREHGTEILMHTDAVQAFGKIPLNVNGEHRGIDLISVSGHKIHGPKGIGGLYIRKGLTVPPLLMGGGQEGHMRSGTENTAGIAGFGEAVNLTFDNFDERIAKMAAA